MALLEARFVKEEAEEEEEEEGEEEERGTPTRYVHLKHLYTISPCINASGASNVMSKKVKAGKVTDEEEVELGAVAVQGNGKGRPFLDADVQEAPKAVKQQKPVLVYHRRAERPRHCGNRPSFFDSVSRKMDLGSRCCGGVEGDDGLRTGKKQKRLMKYELLGLGAGAGAGFACGLDGPRLRASKSNREGGSDGTRTISTNGGAAMEVSSSLGTAKKWVE